MTFTLNYVRCFNDSIGISDNVKDFVSPRPKTNTPHISQQRQLLSLPI